MRGIDRLDIQNGKQGPVAAPELSRLARQHAAGQPGQFSSRSAEVRALIAEAIPKFWDTNPTQAKLVRDLFFGNPKAPGRKYASDLLKYAREQYGEPSEERFREIRNDAFRHFAEYLVSSIPEPTTPVASPFHAENFAETPGASATRRFVKSPLAAVLQFSQVDPGDSGKLTIGEHQAIIETHGRCWWGWFRAAHDADHTLEIQLRVEDCEIGLWERSEDFFYVARCDNTVTDGGRLIESPDKELTPAYYRTRPYPAWFNFRSIKKSSRQEFEERFGYLPTTPATIHWSSETAALPPTVAASGNSILQLSDLRFGPDHRWNTATARRRTHQTADQAIVQTLLTHNVSLPSVGVVVICGNFGADDPSDDTYREALAFVDQLCEQLPGVSREHVVIVPGADDFARPGDRERSGQLLYRDFYQDLYGGEEQDISRMRRYDFEDFRLNVLPVNSVKMLGTDDRDDGLFGYGYDAQLTMMRDDYLRNHGNAHVINAVVAHHHIMPTTVKSPETAHPEPVGDRIMLGMYDSLDIRARLSASRAALYLHGHLHMPDCYAIVSDDGWQTAIFGAGTAGASDKWLRSKYLDNRGNSLGLIQVMRDKIHGSIYTYNEDFRSSSSPFKQLQIKSQ